VLILEGLAHAQARGARILAKLLSSAVTCEPRPRGQEIQGTGLRRAIGLALHRAELNGHCLGHVIAQGLSTIWDDRLEAQAIHDVVPMPPVTALKSYFGNLGAAGGAMETAASALALDAGLVPPTLNYERPDPSCPVQVVRHEPLRSSAGAALVVSWTRMGQAAAIVLARPD
jgi:3-oxoacyl-[acyl-carrier-protein] synthase II